jgi:hypothetical protein
MTATSGSSSGSAPILELPTELVANILRMVPSNDVKNVRLTCRFFQYRARLAFERVYLSANPTNIRVFRAIADHDFFRHQVVEIVWDDARLSDDPLDWDQGYSGIPERPAHGSSRLLEEYKLETWCSVDDLEKRKATVSRQSDGQVPRPDQIERTEKLERRGLNMRNSFDIYMDLLRQQEDVISTNADEEAFRYGLSRFPRLRKITITPAAHGFLFMPLYETPMIRSLPEGFMYPMPRGWLMHQRAELGDIWAAGNLDSLGLIPAYWRGFSIAMRVLSQQQQNQAAIRELCITSDDLFTGLSSRMFQDPCLEYDCLVHVLGQPGLRSFDLSIYLGGIWTEVWGTLSNGRLRNAFAVAHDLTHINLGIKIDGEIFYAQWRLAATTGSPSLADASLRSIFPIEKWPNLKHFGLSGLMVYTDDLLALLRDMPRTLRSVELSLIVFIDAAKGLHGLLADMRDTLDWRQRPVNERPVVRIGLPMMDRTVLGQAKWLEQAVQDFLYGDGVNPVRERNGNFLEEAEAEVEDWEHIHNFLEEVTPGVLVTERDRFNPAHETSYVVS